MVLGSFFSGVGDTRVNLEATVVYAVVFAGLAVALSGLIGVDGLAYSIVLANGASTIYSLVVARRKHGVSLDYYSTLGVFGAAVSSAIPGIHIINEYTSRWSTAQSIENSNWWISIPINLRNPPTKTRGYQ
jgi:O-antigen/teichoic acid export membrane protein